MASAPSERRNREAHRRLAYVMRAIEKDLKARDDATNANTMTDPLLPLSSAAAMLERPPGAVNTRGPWRTG